MNIENGADVNRFDLRIFNHYHLFDDFLYYGINPDKLDTNLINAKLVYELVK